MRLRKIAAVVTSVLWLTGLSVRAQIPKHELRGAWIATVINLDWPSSGLHSSSAKVAELLGLMDNLRDAGINTVFFQVRTECDALYASSFEPWSIYLTGQQGQAPDPYFDPLELAIREAHGRGMSLHAWLNPFRCERDVGNYPLAANHPALLHPEWTLTLESSTNAGQFHTILNPGLDEVHSYVAGIVDEIVRRYDVDGMHFDDYFYPYPPYEMGTSDLSTFDANPRGFGNIADWRRDNINRFVATISSTVAAAKPDVVFGISPFGIWRNDVPAGISGLSGADALFADAVAWLDAQTIDYLAPQLYWPFGGAQDFEILADWWVSVSNGRHIYPGLAAYRADPRTAPGTPFALDEIPAQIRFSRQASGIDGNILFRAENLSSSGVRDSLIALHSRPAIPPLMPWRDLFPPEPVDALRAQIQSDGSVLLEWDPSIFGSVLARSFAIYRARGQPPADPRSVTATSENLVGRSFLPSFLDPEPGEGTVHYVTTALSPNSAESSESAVLSVVVLPTLVSDPPQRSEAAIYPNPFSDRVTIDGGSLAAQAVEVFDLLGRRVYHDRVATHHHTWEVPDNLPPGLYLFRVVLSDNSVSTFRAVRNPR